MRSSNPPLAHAGGSTRSRKPPVVDPAGLPGEQTSSFAKGLFVLETMVETARPMSLATLVKQTGLPKTTVYRIVSVLVERGWAKATGQGYGLGYLPLRAAAACEASLDIRADSEPFLMSLRDEVNETVHLATLDHDLRIVYIEKLVPQSQAVGLMRSRVGATAPAYCTGVGKAMLACLSEADLANYLANVSFHRYTDRTVSDAQALLADLEEVRSRRYAICDEEHEEGVSCIAAAIQGRHGEPIAAISLSGPTGRMTKHLTETSASAIALRKAAETLSLLIGGSRGHR